ncbi:hypothetical protein [Amycolatopsis sp. PS_44_ISF1]|uniref:hypothetical protein n=1 Tax=Amycolatopsis sp. PS_44_ISF1 TaxID=2974917 RepID=UPI0028DE6BE7|nr:hypothetical protein [Amycolatopsis sp. PS_44_ISF1]MDT8913486.1 hypothetical protein [Amycolatopsis sp. PS_44_ISF1]
MLEPGGHSREGELVIPAVESDDRFLAARTAAFDVLADATAGPEHTDLPLMAWIYAHGLLTLTRHGALTAATPGPSPEVADLTRRLTDLFATTITTPPGAPLLHRCR